MYALFQLTKLGLALRASAVNPTASRLVGIRVGWMLAFGWGLAATIGAVAGLFTAAAAPPLEPNMMRPVLIYAFAAAVVGGLTSPVGAIVGGLAIGVTLNLVATYDEHLHIELDRIRLPIALAVDPDRASRPPGGPLRKNGAAPCLGSRPSERRSRQWRSLLAIVAMFLAPRWDKIGDIKGQQMGVYFIAILGLNIVTGYTGQISLAQGAFMAIGGYTTAILVVDHGVRDLWTIPIAALVAGVAGFLVGIPALKLSGLYVALATFGLAVAMPDILGWDKLDAVTKSGREIQLFNSPDLIGKGFEDVTFLGQTLTFTRADVLPDLGARPRHARRRLVAASRRAWPRLPRRSRQRARGDFLRRATSPPTRRSPSRSAPRTQASPARCS